MSDKGRRSVHPVAAVMLVLAAAMADRPAAAEKAEGGHNIATHKLPGRAAVQCRICARGRCTLVTVQGSCTRQSALAALELRLKQRTGKERGLTPPALDDRKYRQLRDETTARVPAHTPEWTNPNDSDPGMTILEIARHDLNAIQVHPVPRRALPGPKRVDKSPKPPEEDDDDDG